MRAIVDKYLENPDPKIFAQMTSEEQRHVGRVAPQKKSKAKKKAKQEEPQESQVDLS